MIKNKCIIKRMKHTEKDSDLIETPTFWQEVRSLFYLILLALCIRVLIFEPFHIPSGSMRNTLVEGDYVFSTKYDYGYSKHSFMISMNLFSGRVLSSEPERGDVIIFRPPHNMGLRYIKRLIGLPGEKIELKNGVVFVNDIPLKREFVRSYSEDEYFFDEFFEILPSGKRYKVKQIKMINLPNYAISDLTSSNNFGPFFIPEGQYFFLGDNRDQSADSRFALGSVPFENFISKARFVLFSFKENLFLDNPISLDQFSQIWKWIRSFKTERFFYNFYEN
jgi:signal peptidase I